jgi:uncharacterized protein Yka (UPF0111/DUF47 family)
MINANMEMARANIALPVTATRELLEQWRDDHVTQVVRLCAEINILQSQLDELKRYNDATSVWTTYR